MVLTKTRDGRLHAVLCDRGPGRPLDLTKSVNQLCGAADRQIARLEKKRVKLAREQRRLAEMAAVLTA